MRFLKNIMIKDILIYDRKIEILILNNNISENSFNNLNELLTLNDIPEQEWEDAKKKLTNKIKDL